MRVDSTGPSIEDLRTFLLLAELSGVAEVARRLGIHDSVVSRRLRPFRARYGLIRKPGGSLVLTDLGRQILPTVRALLHEYDALTAVLQNRRQPAAQVLSTAVGGHGAAVLLPEVLARFLREQPGWEVEARVCRSRERIRGVAQGQFDVAVVSHSLEQLRISIGDLPVTLERLAAQVFAVVARRDTPAGASLGKIPAEGSVDVRDLAQVVLVGLDETSGVRSQLERQASDLRLSLRFGPTAGGWLATREYARHGLGAGIVPLTLVTDDDPNDLVIRLLARPLWPSDWLLHREADLGRVRTLKQVIMETAREQAHRQESRVARLTGRSLPAS